MITDRRPDRRRGPASRPSLCAFALVAAIATIATGCGGGQPPAEEVPHGYVEGAEEAAEAQTRLVLADPGSGAVSVVDLLTEQVTTAGTVAGPRGVAGDGRFGYVTGADGSTRVVDTGAWTVDHGDHVHYYRAAIRDIGSAPAPAPATADGDATSTVLSPSDGPVTVLDRAALDRGEVVPAPEAARDAVAAVPLAGHVVVATAEPSGEPRIAVRDAAGATVATIDEPCPGADGHALTRRGAVFGCADGALVVSERDGAFTGTRIPYPEPVADGERARAFAGRPESSTLAARAGDDGAWSLDVGARAWTRVRTGPAVAVTTVGDRGPLLALGPDGVLRAFDPADGRREAERRLMAPGAAGAAGGRATIAVDASRAYVNDPSTGAVHEIDHGDALRVARTIRVPGKAAFMAVTGR